MKGYHFFADLAGTLENDVPVFNKRTTVRQLSRAADDGAKCNVVALLLGQEHQCHDYTQEALVATFAHPNSDTSLGSVSRDYLAKCRRVPEHLARRLHPRLFARIDHDS